MTTKAINFAKDSLAVCIALYCKGADTLEEAGQTLRDRVTAGVLGQKSREKQAEWLLTQVATHIAAHFGVEAYITNRGGVSFRDAEGERHDTALSRLRYLCQDTDFMSASGSAYRKDPVDALIGAFKKLDARQRKAALAKLKIVS